MSPSGIDSSLSPLAALRWLSEAGADEAVADAPVDRFVLGPHRLRVQESASVPAPAPRPISAQRATAGHSAAPARVDASEDHIGRATELAAACSTLAELRTTIESFDGCALKKHASRIVFADGTPAQRILFIGEAPGKDEDLAGLPFVGRAGKLLDRMLAAIELDRRTNVYITNVVNWRPPGNRDPTPEEAASCLPFLRRHIDLVAPGIIVLLGAVATRHVMGRREGIMRLRGSWLEYYAGGQMVPVMPTLHPAYLLRRSIDKRLAWRDLQAISEKIRALGLLEQSAARS